jgi:phosphopantothenoylcysteine synthetase/decarboxylase
VGGPFDAIGSDENKVTVFGAEGAITDWPMLPKRQVAERLWDLIGDRYGRARPQADAATPSGRRRRRQ